MTKRIIGIAMVIISTVIIFAGCSAATVSRPAPDEGAETFVITGECSAFSNGDSIVVSAASDIETGTCGTLSVYSASGKELAKRDIVQGEKNSNITAEFPIEDSWADDVYAFLVFDTDQSQGQPDNIKNMYGERFQNVEGDNIVWSAKGIAVVFQSDIVHIR